MKTFSVVTWNMYCFFDGRDDGTEYDEFRKSSGYTQEKYLERIKKTARYMVDYLSDADVILLEEVEDVGVLKDLLDGGLKGRGYCWFGLAQNQTGLLSVGFLSKVKPESVSVHGIEGGRLILSLGFLVEGESIHVLGIHARSQNSDTDGSIRKEEFSLLRKLAEEKDGLVILIGDFNADPAAGGQEIALKKESRLADTPLLVTGDGGECRSGIYFSPFFDYDHAFEAPGTYFYDGSWYYLDHILLNGSAFDGSAFEYVEARVIRPQEATDYSGRPMKYEVSTGKGFSDHFAVMATFRYT